MQCPKCAHELPDPVDSGEPERDTCPACGVIVAKALAMAGAAPPPRRPRSPARGEPTPRAASDTSAMLAGFGLGLAAWLFPFTHYALSYALTVFHELGHTAVGWAFGYPSFPSFDFAYGGGISIHLGRSTALALAAGGVVGFLAWRLRGTRAFVPAVIVAVLYAIAAVTPIHEALMIAAGHGAELLLAGVCLYRALAPLRWPAFERGTYAACAAFTLASGARFGWQLLASAAFRRSYEQAKGGGHWMDLSRLAEDFFGTHLTVVAMLFCLVVLATPAAAHLAAVNRERIVEALHVRTSAR